MNYREKYLKRVSINFKINFIFFSLVEISLVISLIYRLVSHMEIRWIIIIFEIVVVGSVLGGYINSELKRIDNYDRYEVLKKQVMDIIDKKSEKNEFIREKVNKMLSDDSKCRLSYAHKKGICLEEKSSGKLGERWIVTVNPSENPNEVAHAIIKRAKKY